MRNGADARARRIAKGLTLREVAACHPTAHTPSGIHWLERRELYDEVYQRLIDAQDAAGRAKAAKALA